MAGRVKDGITLHPVVAGAILTMLVAIGLSVRSELNWQHDQIIILTTQKQDAKELAAQEKVERANKDSATDARFINIAADLIALKRQAQADTKQKRKAAE